MTSLTGSPSFIEANALKDAQDNMWARWADSTEVLTDDEWQDMVLEEYLRLCRERMDRLDPDWRD